MSPKLLRANKNYRHGAVQNAALCVVASNGSSSLNGLAERTYDGAYALKKAEPSLVVHPTLILMGRDDSKRDLRQYEGLVLRVDHWDRLLLGKAAEKSLGVLTGHPKTVLEQILKVQDDTGACLSDFFDPHTQGFWNEVKRYFRDDQGREMNINFYVNQIGQVKHEMLMQYTMAMIEENWPGVYMERDVLVKARKSGRLPKGGKRKKSKLSLIAHGEYKTLPLAVDHMKEYGVARSGRLKL